MKGIYIKKLLMSVFLTCSLSFLFSAPQSDLWKYWDSSNEKDTRSIDHGEFQVFLDKYRIKENDTEIARVDYASVSENDRALLIQYIDGLSQLSILEFNRKEQFSYWVNLYNAATIHIILDNYPVRSIRKISKPWDRKLVNIYGKDLSLNDIEHRILRPIWNDPRIHFVVNCASMGCPDLPSFALTAENKEEILSLSTEMFLNHKRGISLDRGVLKLSSIFDWYAVDFGKDDKELVNFLSQYYNFDEIEMLSGKSKYKLKIRYGYDWDLNEY
jgi:Protein of unknown function, DUF547